MRNWFPRITESGNSVTENVKAETWFPRNPLLGNQVNKGYRADDQAAIILLEGANHTFEGCDYLLFHLEYFSSTTYCSDSVRRRGVLTTMKSKILVALIAAMMVMMIAGFALPALAQQVPWGGSQQEQSGWGQQDPTGSLVPPQPVCGWDWDRTLWQDYRFELWFYSCDYGNGNANITAFWNPTWGSWYPS
jgi:hypothetical protein